MFLQEASMFLKALPSRGICFMISSALKIGSRYSHLPWQVSHSSMIFCSQTQHQQHARLEPAFRGQLQAHTQLCADSPTLLQATAPKALLLPM
jgi:hypothetical protein